MFVKCHSKKKKKKGSEDSSQSFQRELIGWKQKNSWFDNYFIVHLELSFLMLHISSESLLPCLALVLFYKS